MTPDLEAEIAALLADCDGDDPDMSDYNPLAFKKELEFEKDYDGTPIAGKAKKPRKRQNYSVPNPEKKSGRGRPQDRSLTVADIPDETTKIATLLLFVVEKYSQEFLSYMYSSKKLEHIFIPDDGCSACRRVRFYVGIANINADGRDKAKGRANLYERRGVFPIKEFIEVLNSFHYEWELAKK